MTKARRKIFDIYAFPGVLKGQIWEIDGWDYFKGSVYRAFEIELPLGKTLETVEYMASISVSIVNHYEPLFGEKLYLIPVDFIQGELVD